MKVTLAKPYREIVAHLRQKVIGQYRAIEQLERALKIAQANIRDKQRPLAILLFAGPTGTGKTELGQALAEAIHGNPDALCRIDSNMLTERHTAASLTGSPPGYVGSSEGNTLLQKNLIEGKEGKPGILVMEEFEKAHPAVFDVFLGIFDKGFVHLNNGKGKIDFSNTIIILTSNAGARALFDIADGRLTGFSAKSDASRSITDDERTGIVMKELKQLFRPEFLNRLDDIVVFEWLDVGKLHLILSKFLDEFSRRLASFPHYLHVDQAARDFLVENGTDVANGARPLKRAITKYLEDPMAEVLVDGQPTSEFTFHVTHQRGKPVLSLTYSEFVRPDPPKEIVKATPKPPAAVGEPKDEGTPPDPKGLTQ